MSRSAPGRHLVVSSGGTLHSYDVAIAAQEAGLLRTFYTPLYRRAGSLTDRVARSAALSRIAPLSRRLVGRRRDALDDELVHPLASGEIVERVLLSAERHLGVPTRWLGHIAKAELFDRRVAARLEPGIRALYGFHGSSLRSGERMKALGGRYVLDLHNLAIEEWEELESAETRRLGVRSAQALPGYASWRRRSRRELAAADIVVVGYERTRRSALRSGVPSDAIRTIPYGADVSRFSYVERPLQRPFRVLYVGPIEWTKGLHYLLEALALSSVADVIVEVIGSVGSDTARYFRQAMGRLGARCVHHTWVLNQELQAHYAAADAFVFPSLIGGIGIVCYEAMRSGLPIITTDGDDVVRQDIEGLIVPERDPAALAAAMARLRDNPDVRSRMGRAAAARSELFTRERFRRELQGVLREACAR